MPAEAAVRQARPLLALNVTVGAQLLVTFVPAIAPVIAPTVAPQLGISADRIGVFTALTYLAAMVSGVLVAPWITWIGPVRTTQGMLLVLGLGAALAALGDATGVLIAAAVIGLAMGCANPALSAILGRHAPLRSTGFFLSMRVAATPIGVAGAGFVLPLALQWVGWRAAVWAACALCVVGSLVAARMVRSLDWRATTRPAGPVLAAALVRVMRDPAMRRLTLVSAAFAMAQQAFLAYSVLLLVRLGMPLAAAAGLFAAAQVACVVTRLVAGVAADRWMPPRYLLGMYGMAMALSCLSLAALPPSPSILLAGAAMVACATTMMGWYGVTLAQMLRIAPREDLAQCTGGAQVFAFAGSMLGPYLFAVVLQQGVSYAVAYTGMAIFTAVAAAGLFVHAPSAAAERALMESSGTRTGS